MFRTMERFWKLDFVRGARIFHGGDLSVVVRKGCYVRFLEMCYNPIGRDDTGRVAVCVLYRNGLYRRKNAEKLDQKHVKTLEKLQMLHE